jgi:stage III sporulation protein AG
MEKEKKPLAGLWGFLKSRGRIWILLAGAIAGIALLVLGNTLGREDPVTAMEEAQDSLSELQAYTTALEEELSHLCSSVSGVGQVQVMITLREGARIVYAADGSGKPVTVGSGNTQEPLHTTLLSPVVGGVGIVCRGGNDPAIQQKLIELVSTTLDISASRVFVTGK